MFGKGFFLGFVSFFIFQIYPELAFAQTSDDIDHRGTIIQIKQKYGIVKLQCNYNKNLFYSMRTRNKLPIRVAVSHSTGMADQISAVINEALTVNGYRFVDQNEAILITIDDNDPQELYNINAQRTSKFLMVAYRLSISWCDKSYITDIKGESIKKYDDYNAKDREILLGDVRKKMVQYFGN